MKPITAQNQVSLGLARCVQLALSGMAYRMFRSSVTVSILALAVAFLVHMLAYGLIRHQTEVSAYNELGESRRMGELLTRLGAADSRRVIVSSLARGNEARLAEYANWLQDDAALEQASAAAEQLRAADVYFDKLPPSEKAVLTGGLSGTEFYSRFKSEQAFQRWEESWSTLSVAPPLGDMAVFRELMLDGRVKLGATVDRIVAGHRKAIAALVAAYPDQSPRELLANPPEGLADQIRKAGFSLSDASMPAATQFAQRRIDMDTISKYVRNKKVRQAIKRQTDLELGQIGLDEAMEYATSRSWADWLVTEMKDVGAPASLTGEDVAELAKRHQRHKRLQSALGPNPPLEASGGLFGLPKATQWLIALSFLVCVVGVANAMLMSVTERFTEIATMKCLGAMDRFVMLMFVMEATIQGLVGGLAGIVLGIVLAALRGLLEYGGLIGGASSALGQIALATLLSLVVGMLLATLAAVGPSYVAARLAPMEAMRVE